MNATNIPTDQRLHEAAEEILRLRAMLERSARMLNALRADIESTLWPNSGMAQPEDRR